MHSKSASPTPWLQATRPTESATQRLDRMLHASVAPFTHGLSPVSLALACADWAWHLGVSPGRQLELLTLATELGTNILQGQDTPGAATGAAAEDPRYRHAAWDTWPFNVMRNSFHNAEAFWREAARVPGMTAHHGALAEFFARQWLGVLAPANWLPTNPVVLQETARTGGANLLQGARNLVEDMSALVTGADDPTQQRFVVGRNVAVTPGKVVFQNRLIELIRYDAQTTTVFPEPVLIVPSWIMKYYILDLSPHDSMVRYLVGHGHTVYMLSWLNPDSADHDLSMDDYLKLGVFDALQAVGALQASGHAVHAVGYCLGGTLLAIAAAAAARPGGLAGAGALPPLKTITLLAAQTDFSEPGELGLFIDEGQIGFLDNITRGKGYLSGGQMAGSFQFLHSRDLVWTRQMREYLMGEREQPTDLMAWNADTTRMPARMHHEYLTSLYLHNALATNSYQVQGRAVALDDIAAPVFLVGTQRDHISPWRSVYKLHRLADAEICFVLTSGGHNAGIVSEPGHAGRSYQIGTRPEHGGWVPPEQWVAETPSVGGSWWPAWHRWLSRHSSRRRSAQATPPGAVLRDAPGDYVRRRFQD